MTGIAGCFAGGPSNASQILESLANRGAESWVTRFPEGGFLGVRWNQWEQDLARTSGFGFARSERALVVADATLHYRSALCRTIKGEGGRTVTRADSDAELILAAYEVRGERCFEALEGEFACIIVDTKRDRVVCGRDFLGRRPLFWSRISGGLLVASTLQAARRHPAVSDAINEANLISTIAGFRISGDGTIWRDISALPGGHTLRWQQGDPEVQVFRHWSPEIREERGANLPDGAVELRRLLVDAVNERLPDHGPAAVTLSGGWDSSAVLGAATLAGQVQSGASRILPVSISYPEGDPGHEDPFIRSIANRVAMPINWISIDEIPFFSAERDRRAARDEPYRHLYEPWNRCLSRRARSLGARVVLDGIGGDQLFQVSDIYLSDLFWTGRWMRLFREWRQKPYSFRQVFPRLVVLPGMPRPLTRLVEIMARRERLPHYFDLPVPRWIRQQAIQSSGVLQIERSEYPDPEGPRWVAEARWHWMSSFIFRGFAELGRFALEEGVELRSPLADKRVVEFALSRPLGERARGGETKRALRKSMERILPDEVLAPRSHRTGTTDGFSHRSMVREFPTHLRTLLESPLRLEEMGIVDTEAYLAAAGRYADRRQSSLRVSLFCTYQAELWLRANLP